MLGLIAVAQGDGLTRTQLAAISGKEVEQPLRVCAQYLVGELPEGPFQVFHKSFADFLLGDASVDYHIDAAAMHRQIADYYWNTYHTDWTRCDDYGLRWLAVHVEGAEQSDRLQELINGDWAHAREA